MHIPRTPHQLFNDLWHEGEIAVLAGDVSVGKSILAVQIAESLARAHRRPDRIPPKRVIYLDFQHTTDQFWQRYSAPRENSKGRVPYQFSSNFTRIGTHALLDEAFDPAAPLDARCRTIISDAIAEHDADVVIIDNFNYMLVRGTGVDAHHRAMTTFRYWSEYHRRPISFLVTVSLRRSRRRGPLDLGGLAGPARIAELADTVFALGSTTLGDSFRYLKHIKSRSGPVTLNADNTAVLRLVAEPYTFTDLAQICTPYALATANSQPHPPLAHLTENPLLGFHSIGSAPESEHFRNYAAEALAAERQHLQHIKRISSRTALVEGILDGSYPRYLNP